MTTAKSTSKKSTNSTLSDGAIELTLKIDKNTINTAYGKVLLESAKQVEIKGFRKGKAPLKMVEASLDKSKLYSRVINLVLPSAYAQALQKNNYRPLIDPQITPLKMEQDKDWEFLVKTAQAPEVKIGNYREYIKKALVTARKKHADADKKKSDKKPTNNQTDNYELTAVLDAILQHAQINPAKILIEHEAHAMLHKLEAQLAQLKLKLEDYLKSIKKTKEDIEKEYFTTAQDNIRLEFALQAIVKAEKPKISDAELQKAKPPKGQESYVRYLLQKQKVLDILVKL